MNYVGIPFADGGRDEEGVDCWGLVRLYLLTEYGIELPTYSETPVSDVTQGQAAVNAAMRDPVWRQIERTDAQQGDVVLLAGFERVNGRPVRTSRHLGVMVDSMWMLHVESGIDSVQVRLSDDTVRHRLLSFWRHQSRETP